MRRAPELNQRPVLRRTSISLLNSDYFVLLLALLYFAALAPFTPGLVSGSNVAALLPALLPLFVVAAGQTIVLITGGIDLSLSSTIALCSITGAAVMSADQGALANHALAVPVGLAAMLAVGACVGLVNGLSVARLKMPPFIVTLTTMMFFSGLAIWLTRSRNIGSLPSTFNAIGGKAVPCLVVALLAGAAAHLLLSRTLLGRWLYAIGHNSRAARISGVPVEGVTIAAYVLSGLLAAVASILYTGQAESGSPVLAQRLLLDIVAATVIGGSSLFGGRGKIVGTLFGAVFIKLIDNSLNLLDLSYFTIMIVKGGVILLASFVDSWRTKA